MQKKKITLSQKVSRRRRKNIARENSEKEWPTKDSLKGKMNKRRKNLKIRCRKNIYKM